MPDLLTPDGDAAAVITTAHELGARNATPVQLDDQGDVLGFVLPTGYTFHQVDSRALADTPTRKGGSRDLDDTVSFIDYVRRHEVPGTTLYVDRPNRTAVAVIDDHEPDQAGWGDHRALVRWKTHPSWDRWASVSGKLLPQDDFAELVETGLTEVLEPAGATLLELAQSLQATSKAAFRSDRRLQNGQVQVSYVEEIDARAGTGGDITIPASIRLLLTPFWGAQPVDIAARLRYRLNAGKLTIGIILDKPDEVLFAAIDNEVAAIRAGLGAGVPILYGRP